MAFQTFTPTELTSLGKAEGVRVYQGQGAVIRYLVMNVAREPFNNLNVRRALAYMMPRAAIAARVYRGNVKPLYSMPPAGLPGHIDAFAARYGRAPNIAAAKRELQRAGVSTPMPIEIWWTPTHYGDASADEYAEMKRGLERGGVFKVTLKSSEWAQYSGVLGTQYNAFQLGWFPDYPDPENYVLSFYQSGNFTENGYSNPKMTRLLKPRAGSHHDCKAARCDQADPAAGGAGRADHPVLAEQHDRGRPLERARNPDHARRCVHHAVLEDLEDVVAWTRGAARAAPLAHPLRPTGIGVRFRRRESGVATSPRVAALGLARHLAPAVPAHAAAARRADGVHPAHARLPAHAGRPRRPDLRVARRPCPAGGGRQDQGGARVRPADPRAVRRLPGRRRARRLRRRDHGQPEDHRHHLRQRHGNARADLLRDARRDRRRRDVRSPRRALPGHVDRRWQPVLRDHRLRDAGVLPRAHGAALLRLVPRLAADVRPREPDSWTPRSRRTRTSTPSTP